MVQTIDRLQVTETLDVFVEMRDGVKLATDIYRPADEKSYPILLMRTPYNKSDAQTMNFPHPRWFASKGYVVVIQDTRGRWKSEGEFSPLIDDGNDGIDTIEWAVNLPNVEQSVGLYGFSYVGMNQYVVAAQNSPYLKCIAPFMCSSGNIQRGSKGLFPLAQSLSWAAFVTQDIAIRKKRFDVVEEIMTLNLPAAYQTIPYASAKGVYPDLFPFYTKGLYEQPANSFNLLQHINVPAFHLAGWYDIYINDVIDSFNELQQVATTELARNHQYLLITPWYHMPWSPFVGQQYFGKEAKNTIEHDLIQWFDRWLKNDEESWQKEKVRYFITGENVYEMTAQWPPQTTEQAYYLSSTRANSISGDGQLVENKEQIKDGEDIYVYHPLIPVPALGGRSGPDPVQAPMGVALQNPMEIRNDILIYTSAALEDSVTVTGEVTVKLFVSTSAEDTDFIAKLIDVDQTGAAYNIADGIVRLSYTVNEVPQPVEPNKVYELTISLGQIGHTFFEGHSIRLHVTSTLFPTYARNPNDFIEHGDVTVDKLKTATQTVYHAANYPSQLLLPVRQ
jgi:uncharacterized protein